MTAPVPLRDLARSWARCGAVAGAVAGCWPGLAAAGELLVLEGQSTAPAEYEIPTPVDTEANAVSFELGVPVVLGDNTVLLPGAGYRLEAPRFVDPPPTAPPVPRVHEVELSLGGLQKLGQWSVLGKVGAALAGDLEAIDRDVLRLLGFVAETWLPLSAATARASVNRDKGVEVTIRGITTVFSTHHYRAWAFEQVQRRHVALDAASRQWLQPHLERAGLLPGLLADGILHNGLYDGLTPPVIVDGIGDNRIKHQRDKAARRG